LSKVLTGFSHCLPDAMENSWGKYKKLERKQKSLRGKAKEWDALGNVRFKKL
jgi:hypothetical protein